MDVKNIELYIKDGSYLSKAIDEKLDKDFNTDVKLNAQEWQSIFDIIKKDQVSTNDSQFGDNDTDINNGKHYVVKANENYQIKQSVWDKIVDFTSQKLHIQQATNTNTNNNVENTNLYSKEDIKETRQLVEDKLIEAGIDTSDKDLVAASMKKYDMMKRVDPSINDEVLNQRLINFAKGYKFIKFEQDAIKAPDSKYEIKYDKKDWEVARSKYKEVGAEFVEVYDNDGDAKINSYEFYYQELIEEFTKTRKLSDNDAKSKALEYVQIIAKNQKNDKNFTEAYNLYNAALGKYNKLDHNNDNVISNNEAGAYMMAMAQLHNNSTDPSGKNTITGLEFVCSQIAIMAQNLGITTTEEVKDVFTKEIYAEMGLPEDIAKDWASNPQIVLNSLRDFNSNMSIANKFIEDGEIPS